jgi:hypothetical protein
MKSPFVEQMDSVQKDLTAFLRPLGFRSKGRSYNRSCEDGVVQVIGLQMGQYEIGSRLPLPPALQHFQTDFYGQFTVNLGIFVREIWECGNPSPPKSIVQEYCCHIRRRLGRSDAIGKEYWWHLDQSTERLIADIIPMLNQDGLPFLERFSTRKAVIEEWIDFNENESRLSARARVDVAVILAKLGKLKEAAQLLQDQIQRTPNNGHAEYVRVLSQKLGINAPLNGRS